MQHADDWVQTMSCPVIRLDGQESIEKNAQQLIEQLGGLKHAFPAPPSSSPHHRT